MATESTCYCPSCQAPRTHRAQPGMRLKCALCGAQFRAPAPADGGDDVPTAAAEPPPATPQKGADVTASRAPAPAQEAPASGSPPDAGAVVVTRARPKLGAPRVDPEPDEQTEGGELDEDPAPPSSSSRERDTPAESPDEVRQRRLVEAGRRGGRSTAKKRAPRPSTYARSTGRARS